MLYCFVLTVFCNNFSVRVLLSLLHVDFVIFVLSVLRYFMRRAYEQLLFTI